jgi:hypothetical protein
MRTMIALSLAMMLIASVTACGGGGGSGGASSGSIASTGSGGSGTGGSSSSSSSSSVPGDNVAPVVVDNGPDPQQFATINELYVSVTLCQPGSATNCQTIDHVQVDTASFGLRILSSALGSIASSLSPEYVNDEALYKCEDFADSYVWGPVVLADVHLAGETAADIPVHVIGVPGSPSVPQECASDGSNYPESSPETLGANGILGIGMLVQDCGLGCTEYPYSAEYYTCSADSPSACTSTTVSLAQQVSNPVAFFSGDNNGVIIELPSIPPGGQATVTGALVFGIDTQSDNESGGVTVLQANPQTATITTSFNGDELTDSYFDTGSDAYFFSDSGITQCSGGYYYCPSSTVTLTATNSGYVSTGDFASATFDVANAVQLYNAASSSSYAAFDDLGAPLTSGQQGATFDWGLPFFFGRNLYVAIAGANTSAGEGPYFAY